MMDISRSSNFIFFSGVVLLLFNGLWEVAGIPTFLVKGLFFVIIVCIFLVSLMHHKVTMPADHVCILATIFVLFSFSVISHSMLIVGLSYFQIFGPIIILIITMCFLKSLDVARLENLFLYFVFLQLFAAIVKMILIGQSEGGGIGTLSIQAGSVSTFIVFFICLISLRYKKMFKNRVYYFLLFGALFFSIVNEKRLGLIVVAVMGFLIMFIDNRGGLGSYSSNIFKGRRILQLVIASILALSLLVLGARYVPTLTEGYTLLKLVPRIISYLMYTNSEGIPLGRVAGMFSTLVRLNAENGWIIGLGPTEFMSSNLVSGSTEIYSFRATGFTIVIARAGLVGIFIYALFFLSLWRVSSSSLSIRLFVIYLLFDFLIYSDTLFVSHGVIFLLCLMLLKDKKKIGKGKDAISA